MKRLMEKFAKNFAETSSHKFEFRSDVSPLDMYLHFLQRECDAKLQAIACTKLPTRTMHIADFTSQDVVSQLMTAVNPPVTLITSPCTHVYIPDDVLKGSLRLIRPEFDSFFYQAFPSVSHLEILLDDYGWIGFWIAMFFSVGLSLICYAFTNYLGGTNKRPTNKL